MTPQDKRYNEYRESSAKVDGYTSIRPYAERVDVLIGNQWDGTAKFLPTYLDDSSIDAVVRKLDDEQQYEYIYNLAGCTSRDDDIMFDVVQVSFLILSTPEQKAEALARTIIGEK